jgi:hypothetical protein
MAKVSVSLRRLSVGRCVALLGFVLAGCADQSTQPSTSGLAHLSVRPVVTSDVDLASAGLFIDQVRVVVIRPPSEVLVDSLIARPIEQQEISVQLTVNLQSSPEELRIRVEMLGSGVLLFEGERDVLVEGSPATNDVPEIPLVYVGPGSNIRILEVQPPEAFLSFGDALQLRAVGYDAQNQEVPQFFVSWTSSDSRVEVDATGLVGAPSARSPGLRYPHHPAPALGDQSRERRRVRRASG